MKPIKSKETEPLIRR